MKEIIIRNALIESLSIDMGGRGILTAWLHLDYGDSSHQGFGGFTLYLPKNFAHHNDGGNYAGHFLYRCMEIAGVENWKDIVGLSVDSVKTMTQPSKGLPSWTKAMIYVWKHVSK